MSWAVAAYRGLRRSANLLLANGFPWNVVQQMPLATIWTEADFIADYSNSLIASHAILIHAAIASVLGGGDVLKRAIEELADG